MKRSHPTFPVVVHKSKYGYDVHCPVLPGCHSQGDTLAEALENIKDAIQTYLAVVREDLRTERLYQVQVAV